MKKSKNRQFHFSAIDVLIVVAAVIASIGILSFWGKYEKANDKFNIEKTKVTHIIQTPSKEQVDEFRAREEIDTVTPYYFSSCNISIQNKTVKTEMFLIDSIGDMKNTLFADSLLKKGQVTTGDKQIYIDTVLADKYSISIDDEIKVACGERSLSCIVAAIFATDGRHDTGMMMAEYAGSVKQLVDPDSVLRYSGAYIFSNDEAATDAALRNYRPLGDLRSRDEFQSDELYQAYLDLRNDADSTQTTFYRNQYIKDVEKRYSGAVLSSLMLFAAVIVFEFLLLLVYFIVRSRKYIGRDLLKDVRNNYTIDQEIEMFNAYYWVSVLIISIAVVVTLAVGIGLVGMSYNVWLLLGILLIPIAAVLISGMIVKKKLNMQRRLNG